MKESQKSLLQNRIRDANNESLNFKAAQLVWLLSGTLEALIAVRIGLKLIGADPASLFAELVYGFTSLFLFPLMG